MRPLPAFRTAALTLLATLIGACAAFPVTEPQLYRPLVVRSPASRSAAFDAVRALAGDWRDARLAVDAPDFRMRVTSDVSPGARDRIVLWVQPDASIAIDVRTELALDDGRWEVSPYVCASYSYSRERDLAARLLARYEPGEHDDPKAGWALLIAESGSH